MKNAAFIFLIFIFCSCSNFKSEKQAESVLANETVETVVDNFELIDTAEQYDFDTLLKNGYHLKYKAYKDKNSNELLQSLILMKGNHEIKMLNETSYPMLHKNLGYVGADFENAFVFAQSFGAGNPTSFQLINKVTGNEIKTGTLVDTVTSNEIVLKVENIYEKIVNRYNR